MLIILCKLLLTYCVSCTLFKDLNSRKEQVMHKWGNITLMVVRVKIILKRDHFKDL